jgi:signal transduction histidine kinase
MDESLRKDLEAVARIDAVPSMLALVCQNTGMRFATVARVTEDKWVACAVHDSLDFGLVPGGELELKTTICDEIRGCGEGVMIDHVQEDDRFRNHHTPRKYGFESYISVPIRRRGGEFFGTLCALDPLPAKVSDPAVVGLFEGFAQLIGAQLDLQDRLDSSEAALSQAHESATGRERFIAVLGHDLRNPLASVEAGVQMLRKHPTAERADLILDRMLDSCRRMEVMIHDVLDFARGRLGDGLQIKPARDGNLAEALAHVVEELTVDGREVRTRIELDHAVVCDVPRVAQLLSNLLGNALTHGDPGQEIEVIARAVDGRFTLRVSNGGEPIPPARLAELFQPFSGQEEGGARDGLGLGLFIAAEIARAHGGEIQVVSQDGRTAFTFVMPAGDIGPGPSRGSLPG